MLIDSHAHLDMIDDVEAAIKRAREAGVGRILNPGTGAARFEIGHKLALENPDVFAAFGIHPSEKGTISTAEILLKLKLPKVLAIGECGLDYHYDGYDKAAQESLFREHIRAAQESGRPLIIHSRDADEDMIKILKQEFARKPFKAVMHCFASGEELLRTALELGFYISASGVITYPNAGSLRKLFAIVPLERLLIETDAPFLAPQSVRGKQNEPAFIIETAKTLAGIKGVAFEDIEAATTRNFNELFFERREK